MYTGSSALSQATGLRPGHSSTHMMHGEHAHTCVCTCTGHPMGCSGAQHRRPSFPPDPWCCRSPCQQRSLISIKSNKQGPAQGPEPYLGTRRYAGNFTSVTSTGVALSRKAPVAGLSPSGAPLPNSALDNRRKVMLRPGDGRTRAGISPTPLPVV